MPTDTRREYAEEPGLLDLPEGQAEEELESEVRRARAELDELRRKQDQIEKEKQRLEELSRRQDELERGRGEMVEKFERALSLVHRETEDCQQRLEQLQIISRNFKEHLRVIQALAPRSWTAAEAPKEINKAAAALEEARTDFAKAQARIALEAPEAAGELMEYEEGYPEKNFLYWLKSGFAFTLPVQLIGIVALVLWLYSLFAGPR